MWKIWARHFLSRFFSTREFVVQHVICPSLDDGQANIGLILEFSYFSALSFFLGGVEVILSLFYIYCGDKVVSFALNKAKSWGRNTA
jgi:hypothetical protein